MKTVFNIVLGLCALVLVYICYASIMGPINFEEAKKHRDAAVIARLIDIRKAQLEYRGLHDQQYTASFDTLIDFVKNQKLPFIFKQGELDDKQLEDGLTEKKAINIINKAKKTGNYSEVKKWGLENFKRDTMWVAVLDTIFPKGFNADSMRYVPFGNGAQFEMAIRNDTAKSGAPFCLLEVTLSIRLSTDGFSFSIFNPLGDGEVSFYEREVDDSLSLTANLKQTFREVEWLNFSFRRVNVLMANKRFTFIPLEFFEDEQVETVFYHNHPKQENELVQYNILHKNNIVVLFGMDKSTCSLLREQYPNIRFYSQASPFIEYFATKSRLGNCRKMYVHLRKEAVDIYTYERGRLTFANAFACKEANDRIYYILYIWKQLGMEQERDELHLTGELSDKEQLLPELRKFIRQVFIMNPATNLDLQAINLCE